MVCWHLFFCVFTLIVGSCEYIFPTARGSSAPFITGDSFRASVGHIFDETSTEFYPEKVKNGDVIFVKTDYLEFFFKKYHFQIANPYILLTHNSDDGAPGSFRIYLEDPKLLAWFAQNLEGESHPKLHPIPIGIANKCWDHGDTKIFSSYLSYVSSQRRPYLCYVNFEPSTYLEERSYVWNLLAKKHWCYVSNRKNLSRYLKDLTRSKFVVSPRGNGLDCHRTWEALLMGAIPIVKKSSLDPLFSDLPVLCVENWEMITESFLNEQYEIIKQKPFDRAKLFVDYWIKTIYSVSDLKKTVPRSNNNCYINMHLGGRLGNQMFQVAAALSLAEDYGAEAIFPDFAEGAYDDRELNRTHFFSSLEVKTPPARSSRVFHEDPHFHFSPIPFSPNMEICGFFQSEKYFKHNKKKICDFFEPSVESSEYLSKKYQALIEHPNTVAIHLRAYKLESLDIEKCFPFLSGEFYMRAAELFPSNAFFVIFSDRIEWAKKELKNFKRPHVFIENEPHYHDFYLMSFCKHQIISTSSFSWWAAYLNKNPDKIVVAPDPWFSPISGHDSSNVIPEEWQKFSWLP